MRQISATLQSKGIDRSGPVPSKDKNPMVILQMKKREPTTIALQNLDCHPCRITSGAEMRGRIEFRLGTAGSLARGNEARLARAFPAHFRVSSPQISQKMPRERPRRKTDRSVKDARGGSSVY